MENLFDWIEHSNQIWVYLFIFGISLVENMFTPLPGDTITVFGAYLAGMGKIEPLGVFISATSGGVLGVMGLYFIGLRIRGKIEEKGKLSFIRKDSVHIAEAKFQRWGFLVLLFIRFFWNLRFAIALFAGMSRLDWKKTAICTLIGTCIYNTILVYLGMKLGENWKTYGPLIWKYNRIFLGIIIIIIVVYILRKYLLKSHINQMTSDK
jgi:membrane protein DedA with SNARE-associated domain